MSKKDLVPEGSETREGLEHMRDDFERRQPPRVVHSARWNPATGWTEDNQDPDPLSGTNQWQRIWWQALVARLGNGLEDGEVPPRHRERVRRFISHYISYSFTREQPLTSQEDVNGAHVLFKVLLGRQRRGRRKKLDFY